jgi:hypothetical protein
MMRYILFIILAVSLNCESQTHIWQRLLGSDTIASGVRAQRDIIWVMGQSNIDGRNNINDSLPSGFTDPTSKVKTYNGGADWIDWDAGAPPYQFTTGGQFAADFLALQMLSDSLSETIYVIKKSRGGTSFLQSGDARGDWNVNSTDVEDHYLPFISRLDAQANFTDNLENRDTNIVWGWMDIGETNAVNSTKKEFIDDASDFIDSMLVYSQKPNLTIFWRELGLNQSGVTQPYIDAQNEMQTIYPNIILVDNDNFVMFDGIHLDVASSTLYAETVVNYILPEYRGETIVATTVKVNAATLTGNVGDEIQGIRTLTPRNTTVRTGTWSTSDAGVATVSATGLISLVATGTATITYTHDESGLTSNILITVN